MVFCTYCGQSFTRDEHLERHILTHTNVKPFKCFTCHMSFARRDLLQRHYTVHGRDQNQEIIPAANGMIPKSAGRTPIACSNCAKTKTKCDKKFPCSRCASRNLTCTLRPTRRATKNAQRVGIPPEGMGLVPGQTHLAVNENSPNLAVHPQQSPLQQGPNPPVSPPDSQTKTPELQEKIAPPVTESQTPDALDHQINGSVPNPALMSTPGHPVNTTFIHDTPLSGFNEFNTPMLDGSDEGSSPQFMLDWSQLHLPIGFDGTIQPELMMNPEKSFDVHEMHLGPQPGMVMPMMPHMMGSMPLITPMESPKIERSQSDLELGSSVSAFHTQRHSSIGSVSDTHSDVGPIITAQNAWSVFRCTPTIPSVSCPKTARLNLELLEQTLRNHEGWSTWTPKWDETSEYPASDHLTVMQLHESTRDKLLAITQSFLHKALEIHRADGTSHQYSSHWLPSPRSISGSNFVLLPPGRVLEYFLRSYANNSERYFPLTSRGTLDANELMHCYNDRAASLLVLMMIAQGAMNLSSRETRMLASGLTEACRISLFDLIERNVIMSGDPIVLHAALLFTVQAAWSGDKWQMDIAMGQRGMYLAMLRHSGALEKSTHVSSSSTQRHANTDQLWSEWIANEKKSRLIYSWVMVDQDLALLHDTAPLFSVNELAAPMPDADRLWNANSAAKWSPIFEQVHEFPGGYSSVGSGARPLSLQDLFRHFLNDELISLGIEMTPLQLRLLLHPLQSFVHQYGQLRSCFLDSLGNSSSPSTLPLTAESTRARLGEVQGLLGRWFDLGERYLKANPMCAMMQTSLVIFHLISLNAVTSFPAIERLARREEVDFSYQQLMRVHKTCIHDVEEAVYHCGQVLRLVRAMPRSVRPAWWSGALYRVGLILWTESLIQKDSSGSTSANGMYSVPGPSFAIDALTSDHPLIIRYLTKREGIPCVTKRDGSQMDLERPFMVLQHCIEMIDDGEATRLSDGIRSKLDRLARG
ncbi:Hypothetical protein R9X50_00010200 [Acrodontium crateriforme]|uniref:Uncharacterized protein n=1 Tax=Acrodontium crateriforme TaxID=150365 RepID=A0AAQ3R4N6_9PEZI|nr:Hypothetical protein R9X50_00010200 [Acrodontium crateriforme]